MARGDYAQRGNGGRNQASRPRPKGGKGGKSGGGMPGWVWMVLGLSFGLVVAAMVYISRPAQPLPGQGAQTGSVVEPVKPATSAKPAPADSTAASKPQPLKLPPKEKPRFTFYDILPGQEVIVPDSATTPAGKAVPGDDGVFVIQVAAYRTQEDADAQKAKLALIGIESRIEKVTIDNKDTYYRVRVGPEKSLARAHTLMARLEQNGIQAVLMKVK